MNRQVAVPISLQNLPMWDRRRILWLYEGLGGETGNFSSGKIDSSVFSPGIAVVPLHIGSSLKAKGKTISEPVRYVIDHDE